MNLVVVNNRRQCNQEQTRGSRAGSEYTRDKPLMAVAFSESSPERCVFICLGVLLGHAVVRVEGVNTAVVQTTYKTRL